MEVARVVNNHKRYILDYDTEQSVLKIEKEYKTVKKDIRCMGFCPQCYKKVITKKELVGKFKLPNMSKERNILKIKEFANEIERVGYVNADKNISSNKKINLFKGCSNPEEYMERMVIPSEERKIIKEYIFEYREYGDSFRDIASSVNKKYGLPISYTTTRRLYREACEEKGIEPLKRKGVR